MDQTNPLFPTSNEFEDQGLMPGLHCHQIPKYRSHLGYAGKVKYACEVLQRTQFRAWDSFPSSVESVHIRLAFELARQGCYLSSTAQNRCNGNFRNQICGDAGCRLITQYKSLVRSTRGHEEGEELTSKFENALLRGLACFAKKINPQWSGRIRSRMKVSSGRQRLTLKPSVAIAQATEGKPDVAILLWYPQTTPMLPDLSSGCPTLSRWYQHYSFLVTQQSIGSRHLRPMALLIEAALLTRSGYACMCNFNQAVFIKVEPRASVDSSVLRHSVYVSKEFKCDSTTASVLEGLLTMMLLGVQEASNEMKESLNGHLTRVLSTNLSYEDQDEGELSENRGSSHSHRHGYGDPGAGSSSQRRA